MEVISRIENIDEIRRRYYAVSPKISELSLGASDVRGLMTFLDVDESQSKELDFRDRKLFMDFMLRNLVLQARWNRLKSQRLGETFVSGNKPKIIRALGKQKKNFVIKFYGEKDRYPSLEITASYRELRKQGATYTRWALTKSLRAYRRIGLLLPVGNIGYGSSKFKSHLRYETTLPDLNLKLISERPRRHISNPMVKVTNHSRHLSTFLTRYKSGVLIGTLKEFEKTNWYTVLLELPSNISIDDITMERILKYDWGKELKKSLEQLCTRFWRGRFSSFVSSNDASQQGVLREA